MTQMILRGDRNQCQGCKEYFNSGYAFENHRRGEFGKDRRCLTPQELITKGWSKNQAGFWITSVKDRGHLQTSTQQQDASQEA